MSEILSSDDLQRLEMTYSEWCHELTRIRVIASHRAQATRLAAAEKERDAAKLLVLQLSHDERSPVQDHLLFSSLTKELTQAQAESGTLRGQVALLQLALKQEEGLRTFVQGQMAAMEQRLRDMTDSQRRCWDSWTLAEQNLEEAQADATRLREALQDVVKGFRAAIIFTGVSDEFVDLRLAKATAALAQPKENDHGK